MCVGSVRACHRPGWDSLAHGGVSLTWPGLRCTLHSASGAHQDPQEAWDGGQVSHHPAWGGCSAKNRETQGSLPTWESQTCWPVLWTLVGRHKMPGSDRGQCILTAVAAPRVSLLLCWS